MSESTTVYKTIKISYTCLKDYHSLQNNKNQVSMSEIYHSLQNNKNQLACLKGYHSLQNNKNQVSMSERLPQSTKQYKSGTHVLKVTTVYKTI